MTEVFIKKSVLMVLVVSAIGAIILSFLVYYYPLLTFDMAASKFIQSEGGTTLEKALILFFLKGISSLGIPTVAIWLVVLTAFGFWYLKYYREAIYFLSTLFSPVINFFIKNLINRPRPNSNQVIILDQQNSQSFPSGHVMFFTVFFGYLFVLMFITKKIPRLLRILIVGISVIIISTVSISRIYLGAHWFTDALGGYFFGFIYLSIMLYYYFKNTQK